MLPLMTEGLLKAKDAIRTAAIEETLAQMEPTLSKRFESAQQAALKPVSDLLSKQEQFQIAFNAAKMPEEKLKYQHYLEAIGWMLKGTNGH